jgi:hypothetical protein
MKGRRKNKSFSRGDISEGGGVNTRKGGMRIYMVNGCILYPYMKIE